VTDAAPSTSPRTAESGNWFIGLPVPPGRWFERLVASAPADLRRFHPDELHATVAFLGRSGEARARAAWETLPAALGGPFVVTLDRLEPLGPRTRPSALSLTFAAGRDEVAAWIGAHRGPMWDAAGARPDERPPLPHVTVLRPRRDASAESRRRALAFAGECPPLGVEVSLERISLYAWSDERRERLFRIVSERALG
jgi:2'-5' RNA ligase